MKIRINFDMDGTIANLYGVDNWLEYLMNEDATPYAVAEPMVRLCALAKRLNTLQREGYEIGIISWLSKNGSVEYGEKVTAVKIAWLKKHMPSVHWDKVVIVPYGTPKQNFCENSLDVLFDDEKRNRDEWNGRAFDVQNILEVLAEL